jgi:glycosyltransferase involved in cell wall biosynthesis
VTVCRLDPCKGLDRAIRIHKRLDDEGISFRWYVVGGGPEKERLKELIQENHLDNKFILLGTKINPYPYFKKADLVAMLSYHEGFCIAVTEAKILERPIIITKFSAANEQIESGKNGLIVENDEEAIYEGMKKLIQDPFLRSEFSHNLQGFTYDNSQSYKIMEELFQ